MSQHIFETTTADGVEVTVIMGYDLSLDYVFLLVEDPNGEMLYSHLNDPHAGTEQRKVDYYRPILASFGITIPEGIFREVEKDQIQRVGDRDVFISCLERTLIMEMSNLLASRARSRSRSPVRNGSPSGRSLARVPGGATTVARRGTADRHVAGYVATINPPTANRLRRGVFRSDEFDRTVHPTLSTQTA